MDRLFLDANILFSAAYRSDAGLRRLWRLPAAKLITSTYASLEARRNLNNSQCDELDVLLREVEVIDLVPPAYFMETLPDLAEKDRPILFAAVGAKASHLITGDITHFGPFFGKKFKGVLIVSPADYLTQRR